MKLFMINSLLLLVIVAGCTDEAAQQTSALTVFAAPQSGPVAAGNTTDGTAQHGLAGSKWQLVNISSMDDHVDTPDDRSQYTLEFGSDGTVSLRADCNRGMGSWTSDTTGQLGFGPVASTRAMCPPGSLSDRYLNQFQWVRSYVMKNGHLFMATMADGSIIEFEPMDGPPLAATVLGEEIRAVDAVE